MQIELMLDSEAFVMLDSNAFVIKRAHDACMCAHAAATVRHFLCRSLFMKMPTHLDRQVPAPEPIARNAVGTAAHDDGARIEFFHHLVDDGAVDVFVRLVVDTFL